MDTAETPETPQPNQQLARLPEIGRLPDLPSTARLPRPFEGQSSTGGNAALSVRMVLRGLARHWWQALALWIAGTAALAVLIYLRYEPVYESLSLLYVDPRGANPYGGKSSDFNDDLNTQIELIVSPRVLSEVAVDPKVTSQPSIRKALDVEAKLRDMLKVTARPNTFLIEVIAESPSPTEAKTIVESVVASYLKVDKYWADVRNTRRIQELRAHATELESEIKTLEDELIQLAKREGRPSLLFDGSQGAGDLANSGSDSTDGSYTVDINQYASLQSRLLNLEFEKVQAEAELDSVREETSLLPQIPGGSDQYLEARIDAEFLNRPEVQQLKAELSDVVGRLEKYRRMHRNAADPSIRSLVQQQQELESAYNLLWDQLEPQIRAQLAPTGQLNPESALQSAVRSVNQIDRQIKMTRTQLEELKVEDREQGANQLKSRFITQDLNSRKTMAERVDILLSELEFDARGQGRIQQVSPPMANEEPVSDNRVKMLAMAPLAVLGLVLGLVTLVEMRAGRVTDTDSLSNRVTAEVFAVPPLPDARSSKRRQLIGPESDPKFEQFVQQLEHLRVALCGDGGPRGRCVMITSAVGSEGKTTLAAQLAVRCAEAGTSTVVIDADLRRATLGRLFEVPECPGLSDVLRGDATLEDALAPIAQVDGCQILPAGSPESNPNRVLRGQSFGPMIERLRRSFDVVIIDTPPLLPVPDALILGRYADGAVVATRHDQSRMPAVERTNHLLAGAGIPVLGVVVNGARSHSRYGGYYGYGYASYGSYTSYRSTRSVDGPDDDLNTNNG